MTELTAQQHNLTIVATDQDGDTESITENAHAHLDQLLREAVRKLIGHHANPDDYDLLIAGEVQEDLGLTLAAAGLHDGSEVLVMPKDVSRG